MYGILVKMTVAVMFLTMTNSEVYQLIEFVMLCRNQN